MQTSTTINATLTGKQKPQRCKKPNASMRHNLQAFLRHNDLPNSLNTLNDHSVFKDAPVLMEGWIEPNIYFYRNLSPRRSAPLENQVHFAKFEAILSAVPYDEASPVCLDRHGRLMDGAYRMYVMAQLNERGRGKRIYVRMYDFE
ncbi:hypothetical protein [Pontibacter virosus]|uniref:Uncharacterized protein n=1 Tax=Pontibacter virosus TaxID=1765052 RepID=A0A2U1B3I7_9BACT|nr:hypothetical protein [Pontibacter virosus]PVY43254.1 hypothetical protein C8E01_102433 [Pontibacter virosus]